MLNFSKPKSIIGLDVSSGSLKLVEVKSEGKSYILKAFARTPLPRGAILNDSIVDTKTFNFCLKQALDKPQFGRFDTHYINVSLPESKSFLRVIQIPKMSDAEAEAAVPYEAESFIPMPVEQVYLDWQKINEAGDKQNILIIATPREYVDKYLEALDTGGLTASALEAESQSLCRSLIAWNSTETSLIVDIDANRSNLVMVESGGLQFSSTVPIAGGAFTDGLSRSLGVSSVKGEEIKKKVGLSNTTEYPNVKIALMPVLNNLTAEIKNVLKFHSERSERPVEKVILAGGGAKLKGLPEAMQAEFGQEGNIKVEIGDPWKNIESLKSSALSGIESSSWATAIGLALRNIENK
ncbi:MAG: type IV pilus assembly protein PilM [Candidatus Doudnabacteria bacterium]|nr:type IV pilus assembly protein PilM [Candidatus Doudnabacteria bacterium]